MSKRNTRLGNALRKYTHICLRPADFYLKLPLRGQKEVIVGTLLGCPSGEWSYVRRATRPLGRGRYAQAGLLRIRPAGPKPTLSVKFGQSMADTGR